MGHTASSMDDVLDRVIRRSKRSGDVEYSLDTAGTAHIREFLAERQNDLQALQPALAAAFGMAENLWEHASKIHSDTTRLAGNALLGVVQEFHGRMKAMARGERQPEYEQGWIRFSGARRPAEEDVSTARGTTRGPLMTILALRCSHK
jgi:hypothetical protein